MPYCYIAPCDLSLFLIKFSEVFSLLFSNFKRKLEKLKIIEIPKGIEKQPWFLNKEQKVFNC
jgi:hypothetical protein